MKARVVLAEFMGTAGLLIVVVGSGIMGEALSGGNRALALLANSLATGAGLYALIQTFGPVSGAHFNPVVSLIEYFWKSMTFKELKAYVVAQLTGALLGVVFVHFMFGLSPIQLSLHERSGLGIVFSEVVATLGLILVIALSGRKRPEATPAAVSLYITAAYWGTSSTSFANPAVTIARMFTNTFSGIHWTAAPGFIVAQLVGSFIAFKLTRVFVGKSSS